MCTQEQRCGLRREEPDKSRLLFGMGVLGGLFLTVILI